MAKSLHSNIKLTQLRALAEIAECGNFGEAALRLGLTQSTISYAIASLEEELGVMLLVRGRSGTHLTPAGADIIGHIREMLRLLDAVIHDANRHKGLHGGQVRIATFRGAAAHLLPRQVANFTQRYPDIDVGMTEYYDYVDVEQEVRDGKADIGITFLPTGDEFESFEMVHDPYLVLLPTDSPITATQLSWEQLLELPLILYPDDNSCFQQVQSFFRQAGYRLSPRYQFRETSTILSMVEQGLGAAILPQLSIASSASQGRRCDLPVPLNRTVGAVILANALQPPAVFAFLEVLKSATHNHDGAPHGE